MQNGMLRLSTTTANRRCAATTMVVSTPECPRRNAENPALARSAEVGPGIMAKHYHGILALRFLLGGHGERYTSSDAILSPAGKRCRLRSTSSFKKRVCTLQKIRTRQVFIRCFNRYRHQSGFHAYRTCTPSARNKRTAYLKDSQVPLPSPPIRH